MNDIEIESNLPRAILLYVLITIAAIVYVIINRSIGGIIAISLVAIIFLQFIFSKKIFKIRSENGLITFNYLQIIQKKTTYDISSLTGKLHKDVQFRGGKDLILEIIFKKTGKKIFEINRRLCKSEDDFRTVLRFFNISPED